MGDIASDATEATEDVVSANLPDMFFHSPSPHCRVEIAGQYQRRHTRKK